MALVVLVQCSGVAVAYVGPWYVELVETRQALALAFVLPVRVACAWPVLVVLLVLVVLVV